MPPSFSQDIRHLHVPGTGLLPPGAKPLFPAGLAPGELVRVHPPCPPWRPESAAESMDLKKYPDRFPLFDDRYWRLGEAYTHHPNDTLGAWKNDPGPGMPVTGMGHGLGRVPDPVDFRFNPRKRKRGMPEYWEAYGVMIVGSRLLDLFLETDPEAIVHRRIEMRDLEGNLFDDSHHFVDVVRHVEAVDYANSLIDYYGGDRDSNYPPAPQVYRFLSPRFLDGIDDRFHLFRQADPGGRGWARGCFVSKALRDRIKAAKPAFQNLALDPLYRGF